MAKASTRLNTTIEKVPAARSATSILSGSDWQCPCQCSPFYPPNNQTFSSNQCNQTDLFNQQPYHQDRDAPQLQPPAQRLQITTDSTHADDDYRQPKPQFPPPAHWATTEGVAKDFEEYADQKDHVLEVPNVNFEAQSTDHPSSSSGTTVTPTDKFIHHLRQQCWAKTSFSKASRPSQRSLPQDMPQPQ